MFVLRSEIVTIFEPKMVTISAPNTNIYYVVESEILKNTQWDIFHIFTSEDMELVTFSIYAIFYLGLYTMFSPLEDKSHIFASPCNIL